MVCIPACRIIQIGTRSIDSPRAARISNGSLLVITLDVPNKDFLTVLASAKIARSKAITNARINVTLMKLLSMYELVQ